MMKRLLSEGSITNIIGAFDYEGYDALRTEGAGMPFIPYGRPVSAIKEAHMLILWRS